MIIKKYAKVSKSKQYNNVHMDITKMNFYHNDQNWTKLQYDFSIFTESVFHAKTSKRTRTNLPFF